MATYYVQHIRKTNTIYMQMLKLSVVGVFGAVVFLYIGGIQSVY